MVPWCGLGALVWSDGALVWSDGALVWSQWCPGVVLMVPWCGPRIFVIYLGFSKFFVVVDECATIVSQYNGFIDEFYEFWKNQA